MEIFKKELKDTLLTTNPDDKKSDVIAVRVYEAERFLMGTKSFAQPGA